MNGGEREGYRQQDIDSDIVGKKAYHNQVNDVWYTQVKREKNDFEAWRVKGKRAKHQGAIECKQGTLYESSSHPDTLFE